MVTRDPEWVATARALDRLAGEARAAEAVVALANQDPAYRAFLGAAASPEADARQARQALADYAARAQLDPVVEVEGLLEARHDGWVLRTDRRLRWAWPLTLCLGGLALLALAGLQLLAEAVTGAGRRAGSSPAPVAEGGRG